MLNITCSSMLVLKFVNLNSKSQRPSLHKELAFSFQGLRTCGSVIFQVLKHQYIKKELSLINILMGMVQWGGKKMSHGLEMFYQGFSFSD